MNKLLATLLAGAFALSLGASAFAADASKPAEPLKAATSTKVAEAKSLETKVALKATLPAKTEAVAEKTPEAKVKHVKKHGKKVTAPVEVAPAASAPAAK